METVLLQMSVLRSDYRGVIRLLAATDANPEIEFQGGEGPEQVMDQIQGFAVPRIRAAIAAQGPDLLWQELDLDAGIVRRHRSRLDDRLEFTLCPDDHGIELILDRADASSASTRRPWVPLSPAMEPGREHLAVIGWSAGEPTFRWRYVRSRYAPPTIEMTWSCSGLPRIWSEQIRQRTPALDCRFGRRQRHRIDAAQGDGLSYRGYGALPPGSARPAFFRVSLEQPLVVLEADSEASRHVLDADVPVTIEALDFRALLDGRATRLVEGADLRKPFAAEVWVAEEIALPDEIPAGMLAGLPWTLRVESAGTAPQLRDPGESGQASMPQRWLLTPRPDDGRTSGCWGEVAWRDDPPTLLFGCGDFEAFRAPRIARVDSRRARVGWRLETGGDDPLLCLSLPHWLPVGCPRPPALLDAGGGSDYAAEVRADIGGLGERFAIDQLSEVPRRRIFLGPRRWRFRDDRGAEIDDGEALGEVAGWVRWRRPTHLTPDPGEAGSNGSSPTDWAGGSAPVLLLRQASGSTLDWGGLYVPEALPWASLDEVRPQATADGVLLTSRSPLPAIWIDLWGFVCRYDEQPMVFAQSQAQPCEATGWVARQGLPLFPRQQGVLLRSFNPLYAVRDSEPRRLGLCPTRPRPTLHVGSEIARTRSLRSLDVGAETYLRWQIAEPDRLPDSFGLGQVPGVALALADSIGRRVLWLALEQKLAASGPQAGYLISWDSGNSWRFRGFFARRGGMVELGRASSGGDGARVYLGDDSASRRPTFSLSVGADGAAWSDSTPAHVASSVGPEVLRRWEKHYFAHRRRPAPLRDFEMRSRRQSVADEAWIFDFHATDDAGTDRVAGIRAWQTRGDLHEDGAVVRTLGLDPPAGEAAASAAGPAPAHPAADLCETRQVRLAESAGGPRGTPDAEPAASPASEPPTPQATAAAAPRRILRADDDDDF